ncbi:transcriptional regulator [Microbacterium nanhaiense]|uniref:Transcriptional regulator n=1 Tax=Microbacterium nanhaiense TaxID=1301026 RepID=A0ABQ2N459_9MICO|nr:MurR/RpiR family transcriptional regulator [Microbacterium nanhaiense]GGO66115.1 transcriptional regulator [Microbacterium nanhaiense]
MGAIIEPGIGETIDHVLAMLPDLLPSEQRVARMCAESPDQVIDMSGADLAARTETSPATVSRACQAMGFRGFQHLRLLLVRDLGARAQRESELPEGTAGRLQALSERAADMVRGSLSSVDAESFEAAVEAIATTRRLLIVSTGASAPSAQAVAVKFIIDGRSCEAPADGIVQQLTASVLQPGDVCLAVSESGANSATLAAAAAAHEAGATVIGVTSFARAPLAEHSDLMLIGGARTQAWSSGALAGNLIQVLLLSALQMEVSRRMSEDSARARRAAQGEMMSIGATDDDVPDTDA